MLGEQEVSTSTDAAPEFLRRFNSLNFNCPTGSIIAPRYFGES
jgi:hypothetical protein